MNQNRNRKTIHLISIPVPIPLKCAKMAKEPELRFLGNRNRLSTKLNCDLRRKLGRRADLQVGPSGRGQPFVDFK